SSTHLRRPRRAAARANLRAADLLRRAACARGRPRVRARLAPGAALDTDPCARARARRPDSTPRLASLVSAASACVVFGLPPLERAQEGIAHAGLQARRTIEALAPHQQRRERLGQRSSPAREALPEGPAFEPVHGKAYMPELLARDANLQRGGTCVARRSQTF